MKWSGPLSEASRDHFCPLLYVFDPRSRGFRFGPDAAAFALGDAVGQPDFQSLSWPLPNRRDAARSVRVRVFVLLFFSFSVSCFLL